MKAKRISIVMCTYNGARYVRQQMDSLLAQTLPADEIIVQDDGSTDATRDILAEYASRYPHVSLYRNAGPRGVNSNFFSALQRAHGDYIAISDQDDIWMPDKLARQVEAIGDNLLCAGRSHPFSSNGAKVRVDPRRPNYDLLRLLFIGGFSGHTILLSKELLEKLPPLQPIMDLRYYDVILAMTAAAYNRIAYIDEVLVHHRRHTDAASYASPTDNRLTPLNILRQLVRTWNLYRELRPAMRQRLQGHLQFLQQIDSQAPALADALQMLRLQTGHSLFSFLRLQLFCIRHCDRLFYTPMKKTMLTRLRGAYFPISCSEYFRYLSKRKEAL